MSYLKLIEPIFAELETMARALARDLHAEANVETWDVDRLPFTFTTLETQRYGFLAVRPGLAAFAALLAERADSEPSQDFCSAALAFIDGSDSRISSLRAILDGKLSAKDERQRFRDAAEATEARWADVKQALERLKAADD